MNFDISQNDNILKKEFRIVNLFELSEEDCVIVKGNLTAWQKVSLVERRILEVGDELYCLERDKSKLEENIQQYTE